jgi:hypothetical protein
VARYRFLHLAQLAASAFSRIKFLAAKSVEEFLRVSRLLETVDVKPLPVVKERVPS